jgi:hypothetical protein
MDKHQSYNNLVEKKLAQLPATDAEGLWSSMEAILDEQMPQKKRRPGLWGWLFAHKAWMLATLLAVSAAGASLVYFGGDERSVAQHAPLSPKPASQQATPALSGSNATTAAIDANAPGQDVAAPVAAVPEPSVIPSSSANQNTTTLAAAPASARARTYAAANTTGMQKTTGSGAGMNGVGATPSSIATPNPVVSGVVGDAQDTDPEFMLWAATTNAIAPQPATIPSVDPSTLKVNTDVLDSLSQQIASAAAAAEASGRLPEEKGPYVGVVLGMDMSSVKFGSVKTGNNKGLLVGYAFNNRWSVESGVLWSRKNYFADGALYKADGYTPQPGLTILDVNSTNQLYELPINVKYNILAGRNKLFATAGVSSYIIRKENIDLHYDWNGQQGNQYYDYSNVSKHWLSVASFSLGYTHHMGSLGTLRLEPYVKMPLEEIGICNMRVTSMGLNVGFVRMLRR